MALGGLADAVRARCLDFVNENGDGVLDKALERVPGDVFGGAEEKKE